MEQNYAVIKNNNVINTIILDNPSEEILNYFKNYLNADYIILATEKTTINGTYDGFNFWFPQPYPSWIKDEATNDWKPPVPYPQVENDSDEVYVWDEPSNSWLLLLPS